MAAAFVASPAAVTRTRSGLSRFSDPASTVAPAAFGRGQLSPVRIASSTLEDPETTSPSAGTVAPAATRTTSPGESSAAATRSVFCVSG